MLNICVLDAATLGEDLDLTPLSRVGQVRIFATTDPEEVAERLVDCDIVLINKIKLGASNLKWATRLKLICVAATGYDNIDVAYCRAHGIGVANVVGYSTNNVAQLTVAMALSLITHLPSYNRITADGSYTRGGVANCLTPAYHEIAGKTWGVAGYGNIGGAVGRIAEAMGCRVLAYKRTPVQGVECVDLETLCRESDILSIHLPLVYEFIALDTHHILRLIRSVPLTSIQCK